MTFQHIFAVRMAYPDISGSRSESMCWFCMLTVDETLTPDGSPQHEQKTAFVCAWLLISMVMKSSGGKSHGHKGVCKHMLNPALVMGNPSSSGSNTLDTSNMRKLAKPQKPSIQKKSSTSDTAGNEEPSDSARRCTAQSGRMFASERNTLNHCVFFRFW